MKMHIIFGGGCFWCMEAAFKAVPGVEKATPGYSGGTTKNPSYQEVSRGTTGHAEVVRIEYNPKAVSLKDLLEVFFLSHDPTTKNRQGNDIGSQYRSIIMAPKSKHGQIEAFMEKLEKKLGKPITTELKPPMAFYPAEDYHMDYYRRNPLQPYCLLVIRPKLSKVKAYLDKADSSNPS